MLRNLYSNTSGERQASALASIVGTARAARSPRSHTGATTARMPQAAAGGKNRRVYTADNGSSLPGGLVRGRRAGAVTDVAVNEAYDGAGATYDLFWESISATRSTGTVCG